MKISMLAFCPYFLLAFSILSLWIKRSILLSGSLFLLSFIMGLLTNSLTLLAIPSILSLGVLFYFTFKESCPVWLRVGCGVLGSILGGALGEQQMPGFNNLKVISDVVLSHNAYPTTLYLNFDKGLVGLVILGFGWRFINQGLLTVKNMIQVIPIIFLTVLIIMTLAVALHGVEFDPKWTPFFWIWAFSNLIFTCIGEEAFFRGVIQNVLARTFLCFSQKSLLPNLLAIIGASVLFGLCHFYGGPQFVFLATLAGLFCGYSYYKTGRIEASILTHFTLNTIHFIGFTYPVLKQF